MDARQHWPNRLGPALRVAALSFAAAALVPIGSYLAYVAPLTGGATGSAVARLPFHLAEHAPTVSAASWPSPPRP